MSDWCWRTLISQEMVDQDDSWSNVVAMSPPDDGLWLDEEFDAGYGGEEGRPFTVWTKDRVYFPICYDGSEWCGSVKRNPPGKPTRHQGGG